MVLISQQARKRLPSFSSKERSELCQASLECLNAPERILKKCGVRLKIQLSKKLITIQISLLTNLFKNGSRKEQDYITHTLFSALNSDDVHSLEIACACLCEIVGDADLSDQLKIISNCHILLVHIVSNINRDETDFLRSVAKIYRVVASRVSDCKMADENTPEVDEAICRIFQDYLDVVCKWLSLCTDVDDVIGSSGVLVEMVRFLCLLIDMYPDMCATGDTDNTTAPYVQSIIQCCWNLLNSLIQAYTDNICTDDFAGGNGIKMIEFMHQASEDGDRIGIDMLIIYLFEALRGSFHIRDSLLSSPIDAGSMSELVLILTRYMQLTPQQLYQYFNAGNDFISSEEDENCELSVRHSGLDFISQVGSGSTKVIFEAVLKNTEEQLALMPSDGMLGETDVIWLEAVLFSFSAIAKKFVKKVVKENRVEVAPTLDLPGSRSSSPRTSLTDYDADIIRVVKILRKLLKMFYINFCSSLVSEDGSSQYMLCIVRGAISKTLRCYASILPMRVSIRPIIHTALQLLASRTQDGEEFEEVMAARLQHCKAMAALLQVVARQYGSDVALEEEHLVDSVINSCLSLCMECSDCTIHIPLETITMVISIATTALSNIVGADGVDLSQLTLPNYMALETISKLVNAGLAIWSNYCYDPFVLEVSKEMLNSVIRYCLFSDDLVHQFSTDFIPPIESVIASAKTGSSQKIICDAAIKLLVDASAPGINKFTTCSTALALPALEAINTMMHISLSASRQSDSCIDVGDTLFTFCALLSTGNISTLKNSISEELAVGVCCNIILCVNAIFETGVDYNYSAALGSFCHLFTTFSECVDPVSVKSTLQVVIEVAMNTDKSNNRRNIIVMGLVHIFSRCPSMLAEILTSMTISEDETALHFLLEDWYSLHPHLESEYSLRVSSRGIMEVIRLYSAQGVSEGFLFRTIRVLLGTLPILLRHEERGDEVHW